MPSGIRLGIVKPGNRNSKLFGLKANIFESLDLKSKRSSCRSIVEKSFAKLAAPRLTSRSYVASASGRLRMSKMRPPFLLDRLRQFLHVPSTHLRLALTENAAVHRQSCTKNGRLPAQTPCVVEFRRMDNKRGKGRFD